jgi:hypothetical protein
MKIIGFNFNKINIEKLSNKAENLKINTNINISEINEIKSDIFNAKEELIQVKFLYNINYDPDFAKIEFKGDILLAIEQKEAKKILKQWKNKEMSENIKTMLFNVILRKSNLKALQLEDEINLPLHIPLPSLKQKEE